MQDQVDWVAVTVFRIGSNGFSAFFLFLLSMQSYPVYRRVSYQNIMMPPPLGLSCCQHLRLIVVCILVDVDSKTSPT